MLELEKQDKFKNVNSFLKSGGSKMESFSVLEYRFPLNYTEFIKYLEDRDIKYKDKNNILAFTIKKMMNGFVIHDENHIKYILIKFTSLGWNDKNKLVEELDKNIILFLMSLILIQELMKNIISFLSILIIIL